MNFLLKNKCRGIFSAIAAATIVLGSGPAAADVSTETAYVFNTFAFLIHGVLVMFMAAGFAMLESGLVRSKNTATICLKNIALYSVAGIMFYLIGYNLMYVDVPEGGWMGTFAFFYNPSGDELALLNAEEATAAMVSTVSDTGYSVASDWFFQMVFVATAASIVSGTVAERIKFWPFIIFVVVLTGVIYPIQASWVWGGGWLADMGFSDFAGSTLVHSTGGWAALTGAIILGARKGKYGPDGSIRALPGANIPLATLGTFILWFGWFGFNGGSQLLISDKENATAVGQILLNTNAAAAMGAISALFLCKLLWGKADLTMVLNGALAGLVVITADPLSPSPLMACLYGLLGGSLVVLSIVALDKVKIDDPVGAISVHGVCGILGVVLVPVTNAEANIVAQLIGLLCIIGFVFIASLIVWAVLKQTMGIRVTEEEELNGMDQHDCGIDAYPEFVSVRSN